MRRLERLLVLTTGIICVALCFISVYPGWINDILLVGLLLSFVVAPLTLIGTAGFMFFQYRRGQRSLPKLTIHYVSLCFAIFFATMTALYFHLPRRLVFVFCKDSFQKLVETDNVANTAFDSPIGPYHIDECLVDNRGGIYFRVYSGADGISPDTMSYGFCYNPNQYGSPFGASKYRTLQLGDGWYCFRASNDWF